MATFPFSLLREIPDFPKPGILFQDIEPLVNDAKAFAAVIDLLAADWREAGITKVAGAEARGFLFSAALALRLEAGVVLLRKPGKLPADKIFEDYGLEYGENRIEAQVGAMTADDVVLVVDDLLATGGTAEACCKLVGRSGATLAGSAFVVELDGLGGRKRLEEYGPVKTLHHIKCLL